VTSSGVKQFFLDCLSLKMKALCRIETLVTAHQITHHNSNDMSLQVVLLVRMLRAVVGGISLFRETREH